MGSHSAGDWRAGVRSVSNFGARNVSLFKRVEVGSWKFATVPLPVASRRLSWPDHGENNCSEKALQLVTWRGCTYTVQGFI